MSSRLGSAAGGAASGAAAGSALGPWGTAGGAVIGGIAGWLGGGGPSDAEIAAQEAAARERAQATGMARDAAQGLGPSAAQSILDINTARANQLALSRAKGVAGANPALAATLASNEAASNSQNAIAQGAALRAQEMNDARAQYLAATGVDVGQAQTRDASQTAQDNLQHQYNKQLYDSAIGGAAQAGGMFTGAAPAAAPAPAAPAPKPQPYQWGVHPVGEKQYYG